MEAYPWLPPFSSNPMARPRRIVWNAQSDSYMVARALQTRFSFQQPTMASQTNSSIVMALAGKTKTASVDIPQPRSSLTFKASLRPGQPAMLPTPPNSISPTLPPHAFKQRAVLSPGSPLSTVPQLDSDIDLQDTVEHANTLDRAQPATLDLDSVGDITPAMLAKYHLPAGSLGDPPHHGLLDHLRAWVLTHPTR